MTPAVKTEEGQAAARVAELAGRFTPAARERIEHFLESFVSFTPQLGLLYSPVDGQPSWSLVAFAQPTVEELVRMYSGFGAVVCYEIDGVRVVVPQLAHINLLDSGVLDFAGSRLVRAQDKS